MKKMTKTLLVVAALACASGSAFATTGRIQNELTTTNKQITVTYNYCRIVTGQQVDCWDFSRPPVVIKDHTAANIASPPPNYSTAYLTVKYVTYTDAAGTHTFAPGGSTGCNTRYPSSDPRIQDINLEMHGSTLECTNGIGISK